MIYLFAHLRTARGWAGFQRNSGKRPRWRFWL